MEGSFRMAGTSLVRVPCPLSIDCDRLFPFQTMLIHAFSPTWHPQSSLRTDPANSELGVPVEKTAVVPEPYTVQSDPFGDESNANVKYKTMTWW